MIILRGILCAVYRSLTIILGTNATSTAGPSRLRASIARHTDIVDYVVTHYSSDVRLSLHQPISALKFSIHAQNIQGLLHGIWRKGEDIVCETNPIHSPFCASELASLMVYADICINDKSMLHTAHMRTALEEIVVRFAIKTLRDGMTFLGIFSMTATLVDIQDILHRAAEIASSLNPRWTDPMLYTLPPSLVSCYITASTDINNQSSRTFYVANPNFVNSTNSNGTTKETSVLLQRHALGQFVTEQFTRSMEMPDTTLDYVYELEEFTLIYSIRGAAKFYALYIAKLSLEAAIEIGDRFASLFMTS